MQDKILKLRKEYTREALDENQIKSNPFDQFKYWMEEAIQAEIMEPNAMVLATVHQNRPSSRVVLLRDVRTDGFTFYTNYLSKKGIELQHNPFAALNFFWPELERQVRIEGKVEKLPESESKDYFALRPRGSQIGAWASPQSQIIEKREDLEKLVKQYEQQFENRDVSLPPHWGGYILKADYFEFWQGRESRLHDRIFFQIKDQGKNIWDKGRLAP
ncbi:MAG: pyridoxamine 5'-phosphate oxidase [Flavobacteriales bacterium]